VKERERRCRFYQPEREEYKDRLLMKRGFDNTHCSVHSPAWEKEQGVRTYVGRRCVLKG